MKILLAYDNSNYADVALERAAMLAQSLDAQLSVISVIPELSCSMAGFPEDYCETVNNAFAKECKELLDKACDLLADKGIRTQSILEFGHPAGKILEVSETLGVDLIVLGSRGTHGIERFLLGSVSSKVAAHAKCDVLIARRR